MISSISNIKGNCRDVISGSCNFTATGGKTLIRWNSQNSTILMIYVLQTDFFCFGIHPGPVEVC